VYHGKILAPNGDGDGDEDRDQTPNGMGTETGSIFTLSLLPYFGRYLIFISTFPFPVREKSPSPLLFIIL